MYRISLLAIIVLSLALPSSSCAVLKRKSKSTNATAKNSLEGRWILSYVVGGDVEVLYKNQKPYLIFDLKKGMISGNNGCNQFSGTVKIEDNKMEFPNELEQTLMACEGKGETIFMDALNKSKTFAFGDENTVDFIGGDLGMMQFKREKSKQ